MTTAWRSPRTLEGLVERHGAVLVLALTALVLLAGIGLRNPWPADEPRFAVIARDMLASGNWLVPHIGGELYAEKPPLYFWLLAASFRLTESMRLGFLLPSAMAGFATVALVFDLTRRLYDRTTAAWAGVALLATFQFALEFKAAQIDPTMTMLTTVSLYALLRHLLLGPAWGWYAFGGFAAGLGVIAKGVGFLPLLVLAPYALLVRLRWPVAVPAGSWRWWLAPLAAVAAACTWLVPMLIAAAASPELGAYRNEILLGQTVGRYVAAPGHLEPWWYFVAAVIPWAWLPVSLALPWLVRTWRQSLRARDPRTALLLGWIVLVVVFFSLSSGKRGVYVLPAVPALAVAAAPYVPLLLARRLLATLAFALVLVISSAAAGAAAYLHWRAPAALATRLDGFDGSVAALPLVFALWGFVTLVAFRPRRGLVALSTFLIGVWPLLGFVVWPQLDAARSGRLIMERAYRALPADAELGLVAQKETLLLNARGPATNFGHRRTDVEQERFDAARWLAADARRYLIIRADARDPCFSRGAAASLGFAHSIEWALVPHSAADRQCAAKGHAERAIPYRAPRR
jgi:4-amino-4-deoxy-L-arabinose transferase-like glycosyltransferase